MRRTRAERRSKVGMARMATVEAERSGELVFEAENVSFSYGDRKVIESFSTLIMRGDKIGIVGPNGAGKVRC